MSESTLVATHLAGARLVPMKRIAPKCASLPLCILSCVSAVESSCLLRLPAGGGPEVEDVSWVRVRLRDKELRREGVLGRGGELDMRMRGERSRSSWADGR